MSPKRRSDKQRYSACEDKESVRERRKARKLPPVKKHCAMTDEERIERDEAASTVVESVTGSVELGNHSSSKKDSQMVLPGMVWTELFDPFAHLSDSLRFRVRYWCLA